MKSDQIIFTNRAIAADTNYETPAIYVGDVKNCSIQLEYVANTTSINGTFKLQSSNDAAGSTPATWSDVADSSVTVTAQANGSMFYNVSNIGYNWIRLVFTFNTSSDSQVINAKAVLKG